MFFRKHMFKIRIIGLILLFSMIPVLFVNLVWFKVTTESLEKKVVEKSEGMLQQLNMTMSNYINGIGISVGNVAFDEEVKNILYSAEKINPEEYLENRKILQQKLEKSVYNNMTISRISLITDNYQVDSSGQTLIRHEFEKKDWYQEFENSGKYIDLTGIYYKDYGHKKKEPTLAYLQRIIRSGATQKLGAIIVEIRYAKIKSIFNDVVNDSENKLFIFDNQKIIYSPDGFFDSSEITEEQKALMYESKADRNTCDYRYKGKDYILIKKNIISTGWTVMELIDKDALFYDEIKVFRWLNISFIILVFVLALIAVYYIYRMLRPLNQIGEYMKKVEQNQFDVFFTDVSEDEFGRIRSGFNKMIAHINQLLQNIEKTETEKREIAIKALKAQINPHFLYNTLNIIKWRAVMAGNESIGNMIVTLIHTMEFNGKRKEEFVLIRDEVDNVKNYVQLLKYHYEDKFDVVYEIDDEVQDSYVCKLILQPLVENAVFHGIIPKKDKGNVKIRIKKQDEIILFEVSDDGVGMNEEQEKNLMQGIGISNVNDRIRYYFGEKHGIQVKNIQGKGITIQFSIPIIKSLPYYRAVMKEGG